MDWRSLIIRHGVAPAWARWERSPYLVHARRLRRTQFDNPDQIRANQGEALRRLLTHAHAQVPFWRERLKTSGIDPGQVRNISDLSSLPLLTKEELRTHRDRLLARGFDRSSLVHKVTSGSTGVPVEVFVDEPAAQFKRACTLRSDEWSGWRLGEPVVRLWGHLPPGRMTWRAWLRQNFLERTQFLDTLDLTESKLAAFAREIRRNPPSLLFGHAHSLYLLAEYLQSQGGPGFQPRGIIATAMVLHDWQRKLIEETFQRRVTNRYGCEEVSLIACECEQGGMHVNADGILVEILVNGRPAKPGEAGAVVVTDLVNRAMPLIRYQVGDAAVASDRTCPCGRGLPLLERLEGRVADYVVTPSGRLVSGISLTDHFACQVPGAAQMQIVQERTHRLLFRIVRDRTFGPHSVLRLGELVEDFFGSDLDFSCEFLDRIPQEPSGKYRFCISRLANPLAQAREAVSS